MTTKLVTVADVMTDDYLLVAGMQTVRDVIVQLKQSQPKPIVVNKLHDQDEFGMLLMRDIVAQVLALDKAPERVNVYEIMKKPVVCVHPNMDIRNCAKLFTQCQLSHAPVLDGTELVGIVSLPRLGLNGLLKHFSDSV